MYETLISENLPRVLDAIQEAAARSGRESDRVTLVAVTKAHPPEALRAALAAGVRNLGENRLDELEEKVALLGRDAATWHMVGHVQSRKAGQAVHSADLVHSVDTLKLARRMSVAAREAGIRVPVLLQVNIGGEEAKSGFTPQEAVEAIHAALEMDGLRVRGLMTMAPFVEDERILRRSFGSLRAIHEKAKALSGYEGTELSMGMTNDFEVAVEEGSTMVRIGTALFGERRR